MRGETKGGCSRRERLEVTAAALVPAALGLLGPTVQLAGRLSWLAPILALPVGLCLGTVWNRLGREDLSRGLEEAFGSVLGKLGALLYLLWGLALLADSGRRYSERILTVSEGEGVRWLLLLTALGLSLWLGRKEGAVFARTGRLFFLAVGVTLAAIFLLALPGVGWENLAPPGTADWRGLPGGGALCLSLAGYGVYALCLHRRETEGMGRAWTWTAWGCGTLAALLFIVVGVFGPTLAGQMGDPFLYLLEGVQVPGAFRRGEAGLIALLTLADLVLLTLLGQGCVLLWRRLAPVFPNLGWLPVAAAFAGAGALSVTDRAWAVLASILPRGNLLLGVLLPVFAVLTIRVRERRKGRAIFSGGKSRKKADIAVKPGQKKSSEENEKKC